MVDLKRELITLIYDDYEVVCEFQRALDIDFLQSEIDEMKITIEKLNKKCSNIEKQLKNILKE